MADETYRRCASLVIYGNFLTKYDLSNILKNKLDKTNRTREELTKGKSVLMIANRLSTIQDADQIVVLADGVVAEKGNHEILMKKRGLYRKLVDLQTESTNWKLS